MWSLKEGKNVDHFNKIYTNCLLLEHHHKYQKYQSKISEAKKVKTFRKQNLPTYKRPGIWQKSEINTTVPMKIANNLS